MRPFRSAEILAVGSEMLSESRIDTNSLFLTRVLNDAGIALRGKSVVRDDVADLTARVRDAFSRVDLVITTGGLGPTDDDLTREAVASALELTLKEDAEVMRAIEARFARRQLAMPAINRRQAMVPEGAEVLSNANGTAPGLWIAQGEQAIIVLPGPPREMQAIVEALVVPRLAERSGGRVLARRTIKTTGWSESRVDEIAAPIYQRLALAAPPIETSILASPGLIELQLSAADHDRAKLDRTLDAGVEALADALGEIVFSRDGRTLEEVAGALLATRSARVAVAESCTGGLLLGRLTSVSGSSGWVTGGVVAYDNAVKTDLLDVPAALIAAHGAVSEPVGMAMAEGIRRKLTADFGIGITGIAGPTGGTPEKPVGTVVVAVAGADRSVVKTLLFPGDRQQVRTHATSAALDLLRRLLV